MNHDNAKKLVIGINARFLAHPYTGIGAYTKNLITHLSKLDRENEYHIACHKQRMETSLENEKLPHNFHFHYLPEIKGVPAGMKKSYWELISLPKLFRRLHVDIVHSPYPNVSAYKGQEHVVTVHDVIPWIFPAYAKGLLSKLYHATSKKRVQNASHILTVSDFSKGELVKHIDIPAHMITVTRNAIGESFKEAPEIKGNHGKKYLIYIGGFDKRKNIPKLTKAFHEHIAPYYSVDLIIVGSRLHDSELYDKIEQGEGKGLKGKIIRTGFISEAEKKKYLKNALGFIHLSDYEGFNIPLLEALSVGTPALVSDIPAHREVAREAALYLNTESIEKIKSGVTAFLDNNALQKELGEKGKIRAAEFGWEKTAKTILDLYNKIRREKGLR